VAASLFDFLLRLEESRALRLQYCFSLLRLRLDARPALSAENASWLTQRYASLAAGLLRSTDIVALLSGDSIGIILIDADAVAVPIVARRIADALELWAESEGGQQDSQVTWSAGAASYPRHGSNGAALLDQAEALMSQARAEGGKRVCMPATSGR
jgi:predicted signal transduction protein with EAL and GGDEF domain